MTLGSWLKAATSWGAKRKMMSPMTSTAATEQSRPKRMPSFTRSSFWAPMFWEMKVAMAMEKAVTGKKAKPSTLA